MRSALLVGLVVCAQAFAANPWADLVPLPPGVTPTEGTFQAHDFDQGTFLVGEKDVPRRGKFRTGYLTRQPEGFHEPGAEAWKRWKPVLEAKGFAVEGATGDDWSLKKSEKGQETSLRVSLGEFQDPKLTVVVTPAAPRTLTLKAPGATSEKVGAKDEFPFLVAPAGAALENTATLDEPLDVTAGGDKEVHLVGRGAVMKQYTPPKNLSKLETELVYRAALQKAGWTVLPLPDGVAEGEGVVRAHWSAKGRELWAVVGRANDDSDTGLTIAVADSGADDWAKALAADCRLPLYGVTFDFDKATLKPVSTPVLEKAAAALAANPSLAVEVQGHTDDVGDDAYNLKLSGQRAETVRAWLAGHGVAAARLSSKGFGKTQPVVENSSDANRARNRRVELRCAKK
ncbi:MAG: OmpA family protein [Myxococcaceae bacterium]|nr:OmpA family protein [Myxococcaceae bacterium]